MQDSSGDEVKPKKPKKRKTKFVDLRCEWEDCTYSVHISPEDYPNVFSGHLRTHADDLIKSLQNGVEGADVPFSSCCMWNMCNWQGMGSVVFVLYCTQ